jgi:hypothetical protein
MMSYLTPLDLTKCQQTLLLDSFQYRYGFKNKALLKGLLFANTNTKTENDEKKLLNVTNLSVNDYDVLIKSV